MNGAHVHLLLNHVPVIGTFFCIFVLGLGVARGSRDLTRMGLIMIILVALTTIGVQLSGEEAEHIVEELPGVSHDLIERHEEIAETAFIAMEVLGALALGGLLFFRRRDVMPRWFGAIVLALALGVAGLMARTANFGGEISHPEIRSGAPAADGDEPEGEEAGGEGADNESSGRGRGRGRGGN